MPTSDSLGALTEEQALLAHQGGAKRPWLPILILSILTGIFAVLAVVFIVLYVVLDGRTPDGILVSVVQMSPVYNTDGVNYTEVVDTNIDTAIAAIETAAHRGSTLVVFPEGMTGWLLACNTAWPCPADTMAGYSEAVEVGAKCSSLAEDSQVRRICDAATQNGVWAVPTLVEIDTSGGEALYYNTAVVVGDGKVQHRYRKSHLSGTGEFLAQPDEPDSLVFRYKGRTFGVLICADIQYPQPLGGYVDDGVDAIIFSTSFSNLEPFMVTYEMAQGLSVSAHTLLLVSNTIQQEDAAAGVSHKGGGGIFINGEEVDGWWEPLAEGTYIQTAPVPPARSPLRDAVPTESIELAEPTGAATDGTCVLYGAEVACYVLDAEHGQLAYSAAEIVNASSPTGAAVPLAVGLSVRWDRAAGTSGGFVFIPFFMADGGTASSPDPYYALLGGVLYCPDRGDGVYDCDAALGAAEPGQADLLAVELEFASLAAAQMGAVCPFAFFYGNPVRLLPRDAYNFQETDGDDGTRVVRARIAPGGAVTNAGVIIFGAL